ncbi:hypothetical protein [Acidaminococcus fermentans]|jgi:sugar/nucleoside kinase (ribokinase family)|uniref:hypothetical protein n=1 Tax=Acidaminococcus fermentans TaxID=905 RepID=UPI00206DDD3D|nr:hypothetical protein [Acidaminococcus fermentans]DAL57639.1 MAG TPA_asm: hypothetical protein [Caudoviricetes sp.]DAV26099.1 MAG TPA: hypothetical protein [Caudoviricetes sp.]
MIVGYDSKGREIDALEAMHRQENLMEQQAKGEALMHLMKALAAAGVHVQMDFDPIREKVVIRYLQSERPIHVVNVAMDNAAAMMFDIFKQAGKELVEEA